MSGVPLQLCLPPTQAKSLETVSCTPAPLQRRALLSLSWVDLFLGLGCARDIGIPGRASRGCELPPHSRPCVGT